MELIVKTPGICGGDARVQGTRISVWILESLRKNGQTIERIVDDYGNLTNEMILAAWKYADENREEIETCLNENL